MVARHYENRRWWYTIKLDTPDVNWGQDALEVQQYRRKVVVKEKHLERD